MCARLIVYGRLQRFCQLLVRAPAADKRAQVGGVGIAETWLELAGARQAHTVALGAELVAHRVDESYSAEERRALIIMRGAVAALFIRRGKIGPALLQHGEDILRGDALHRSAEAYGHELYKAHIHGKRLRDGGKRGSVSFRLFGHHGVYLCAQTFGAAHVEHAQERICPIAGVPGYAPEARVIRCVKADVHTVKSRSGERVEVLFQQQAVRRQRDLLCAGLGFQRGDELRAARAHKRLPARDLELRYPEFCGSAADAQYLLIAEDVCVLHGVYRFGHAVAAAQVAAVSHGYAQVIYFASVLI